MRILILFLSILLLLSCREQNFHTPENLISEDKMVEIITEFMIINAAKGINKKILEDHIADPTSYVFNKFSIDSTQFDQSNAYYSRNIELYSSIYDRVYQNLELKKTEAQSQVEAQNKRLDSLKRIKLNIKDSVPKLQKIDLVPKTPKMRTPPKKFDTLRE